MKVNVYFLETGSHLCLLHRHLIKAHFLFYYLIPNYLFYHFDHKLAPIITPFAYPRGKQWAPYATTDCPFLNFSNLSQGLLNRWTSQLDLGSTTGGLERVVSVHNST